MTDPLFDVYSEFNNRLGHFGKIVIAGGAVRDFCMREHGCEVKTKDFDVFVLYDALPGADDVKLALYGLPVVESLFFWHQSEPFLVTTVSYRGLEVQTLLSPYTTVDALLDSFDWNVSLFAYDGSNIWARTHVEDIGLGKELKLQKVTFPASTLRRGYRFSERFGMRLPEETVKLLCRKVLGQ